MTSMIDVRNLTKIYIDKERGEIRAADGVSFACSEGEILGILGPNGAGKTTTLRMLSTVLQPTSGTAEINGYDIRKDPEKVRAYFESQFEEGKKVAEEMKSGKK